MGLHRRPEEGPGGRAVPESRDPRSVRPSTLPASGHPAVYVLRAQGPAAAAGPGLGACRRDQGTGQRQDGDHEDQRDGRPGEPRRTARLSNLPGTPEPGGRDVRRPSRCRRPADRAGGEPVFAQESRGGPSRGRLGHPRHPIGRRAEGDLRRIRATADAGRPTANSPSPGAASFFRPSTSIRVTRRPMSSSRWPSSKTTAARA